MQLASRNPLLRTGCCWLGNFFCKAYWATPFKMHFDFRPLLRRTFAKIPLSADPSHQQGAHQRKSKHQGPWCLALAKPHFWKLGCCIWSLCLETSESNGRQYQRQGARMCFKTMVFGCGEAITLGSLAATYEGKGKCAVPFSCRTPGPRVAGGGSPWTSCNVYNENDS